jgi:hypothetical protein
MEHNPFESAQTESKRKPSRSATHMRVTMVIFAIVLLLVVAAVLFRFCSP